MFAANTHDHTSQLLVEELVRGARGTREAPSPRDSPDFLQHSSSDDGQSSEDESQTQRGTSIRKAKLKMMQCKFCLVRLAVRPTSLLGDQLLHKAARALLFVCSV